MSNLYDTNVELIVLSESFKGSDKVNEIIGGLNVKDFFDKPHQIIFSAVKKLFNLDQTVDYQTVADILGDDLSKAGNLNYLLEIDNRASSYDLNLLIKTLKEKTHIREMLNVGNLMVKSTQEEKDYDLLRTDLSKRTSQLFDNINEQTVVYLPKYLKASSVYEKALENQDKKACGIEIFHGFETNYVDLDKKIMGLAPGHLIIVGARPGMGKTTLMLNLVERMKDIKIAVFSLEMTAEELTTKLLLIKAGVNFDDFTKGNLGSEDIQQIYGAEKEFLERNVIIDDQPGIKPIEILGRARRAIAAYGVQIIFVDYLQLMSGDDSRYESNQVKVASISRELKKIAKLLNVPVVALAQLNRNVEGRESNRPRISDLRESGSLEADADQILLLHRPSYYEETSRPGILEVIIGKNRFGETGVVDLTWNLPLGRIENGYIEKSYT